MAALSGATLLALAAAEAPVLGSDGAEQLAPSAASSHAATTGAHQRGDRPAARGQGSNVWHSARTGAGPATARAGGWRSAISPSPHLTRAQVDAMTPGQVVRATLGNVVHGLHSDRAARTSTAGKKHARRYSFTMSTFNALGSQHTAPGGDAVSYAPGRIRTQWMADYLSAIGSSVVGMQEVQADQVANLNLVTGGQYSFWPGSALGGAGVPQTLMWKNSVWKPKKLDYIVVPFMGGTRPQPVVLLKNLRTKRKIYVINIHNSPKDAKGRQGERNRAVAIEQKAVRTLRSAGNPVFIVGDFNDHQKAFCAMTDRTGLKSASGGSHPRNGTCKTPRNMRVDWIFGSTDVQLTNYLMDQGPIIQRITDHAVITTKVKVR